MIKEPYLQIADRHIAETELLITQQRRYIDWLNKRGRDSSNAQAMLDTLVRGLEVFRAHRDEVSQRLGTGESSEVS
jgi:hypothetical protein